MMGYNWPGQTGGCGFGWYGFLPMLIFWGIALFALVFFMRYISRIFNDNSLPHSNSIDILKKRYAKGEISKSEYEEMKNDLR